MSKKDAQFYKENHEYFCVLNYMDEIFIGKAKCCPQDYDMESEKIGFYIAMIRAEIKAIKFFIRNELKPELKSLNQLFYSINKSKKFNPKSYEAKMLKRQIKLKEEEIQDSLEWIKSLEKDCMSYIENKNLLHEAIRAKRSKEIK